MTKEAYNEDAENNNGLSVPVSLQSGPSAGEELGLGVVCTCVCVCDQYFMSSKKTIKWVF